MSKLNKIKLGNTTYDIGADWENITNKPEQIKIITSTNDTTDRTIEIQNALSQDGYCVLGPGDFYVSGIEMPANTMLQGQGNQTRVYHIKDNNNISYVFKLNSRCSLSDINIIGNSSGGISTLRSKVGVLIEGTYGIDNSTTEGPGLCILSNLLISAIRGSGIKFSHTGMSPRSHSNIINCNIQFCDCGIHYDTYSEFHLCSNTACYVNAYGVIVKGGNNSFSNCDFSTNKIGIYLPCKDEPNHGHGRFVGCEIAHSMETDGTPNAGYAIVCNDNQSGFRFTSCTFGYGIIDINNSRGMNFAACGFGTVQMDIDNSLVTLNGCSVDRFTFSETEDSTTYFIDCVNRDDGTFLSNNENYTKTEIDAMIGDIETLLSEV